MIKEIKNKIMACIILSFTDLLLLVYLYIYITTRVLNH